MGNRWSTLIAPTQTGPATALPTPRPEVTPALRGVQAPQQGIVAPTDDRRLGRFTTRAAGPFWLGAHGGAGETTLAHLLGGIQCHHRWPVSEAGAPAPVVVLVARQDHAGLEAARTAAQDWAADGHPEVVLAGLVVIAAAPGKTPRALRGQTRVTAGGVPRTWTVPWIDDLHLTGTVTPDRLPKDAHTALVAIDEVTTDLIEGKN